MKISGALRSLACLQRISLNFAGYDAGDDKITNKTLKSLGEVLQMLVSLKEVILTFDFYRKITDSGLKALIQALGKLSLLKSIKFNFTKCGITGAAFDNIKNDWKALTSVENVCFGFNECSGFERQTLENVFYALKGMHSLQIVCLFIQRTGFFCYGTKEILFGGLKKLGFVEQINFDRINHGIHIFTKIKLCLNSLDNEIFKITTKTLKVAPFELERFDFDKPPMIGEKE